MGSSDDVLVSSDDVLVVLVVGEARLRHGKLRLTILAACHVGRCELYSVYG